MRAQAHFRVSQNVRFRLELRQYQNGLASVKSMFVLKLSPFFPHLHGKGKWAATSKQTCFSQKQIRSYIVLALVLWRWKQENQSWWSDKALEHESANILLRMNKKDSNELLIIWEAQFCRKVCIDNKRDENCNSTSRTFLTAIDIIQQIADALEKVCN